MTGPQLKAWMALHGWTVRALCEELELSTTRLQRWRDGKVPVPGMFAKWADLWEASIEK